MTTEAIQPFAAELTNGTSSNQVPLSTIEVSGQPYGVTTSFTATMASQPARFRVAGAAADVGSVAAKTSEDAAVSFVEDLFRQGRVAVPESYQGKTAFAPIGRVHTHELVEQDGRLDLRRRLFD
jgi:hypothetical protein